MIGDFLRSSGKHVATKAVHKTAKGYGKANKKTKRVFKAIGASINHPRKWHRPKKI